MTVSAHFSQRSTCPPSAAVRQRSMAVITFSWSRLTWPALAQRHAAPWLRKISATSSAGRDTAAGAYEAPSKCASRWTKTGYKARASDERATYREVHIHQGGEA